jgi:hypothetical protein
VRLETALTALDRGFRGRKGKVSVSFQQDRSEEEEEGGEGSIQSPELSLKVNLLFKITQGGSLSLPTTPRKRGPTQNFTIALGTFFSQVHQDAGRVALRVALRCVERSYLPVFSCFLVASHVA